MKTKTLFVLFCAFYALQSFAVTLVPGTYLGSSLNDDVTIYVKEVPGRKGSFLAVVTKEDTLGFAYLVDKFNSNKYGMIPLQAMENNVIGAVNHTPSLVLTVNEDKNTSRITIASNNSDNKSGFVTPMSFELRDRSNKSQWVDHLEGTFSNNGEKRAATLTAQDINREATLSIKTGKSPGDYLLREVRPGIHLVLRSSLTTTGVEVTEQTRMIAIFTKKSGVFTQNQLILLDTQDGKIAVFEQR